MTYPSSRVINVNYDTKGRLLSLPEAGSGPTWLSNVTYNIAGQVTGNTLGNGVTEVFGYDTNRMQLTSQKAGTTSPYTNRMDLSYSYAATSGQMGSGSTAGNAGQLMSISGTINGTTESAAYTYDNLGRLVTSNQTSNGSSAQRRFAYDRWGNRTGMWDATSGGEQIQSIALQGSGGIPTNQIDSVTVPEKDPFNLTYDAAGNLTNDEVAGHSYGYDSENRLVSVDGGSTASYAYDHLNRRYKKTVGSTVTHYVWQGAQVLAEHNGSTGAVLWDYVFAGSQMIGKVTGSTANYFLSDRLSMRMTMDSSGSVLGRQSHLAFGEDFAATGTQDKHRFTSYERDGEAGTDYAVNRQYAQGVGRFGRVDPWRGSISNPQSLNRYAYVENDPVNTVDPLGLCPAGCRPVIDVGQDRVVCECDRSGDLPYDFSFGPAEILVGPQPETPPIPEDPCTNSTGTLTRNGFQAGIGGYSAEELNHAAITVMGEIRVGSDSNPGEDWGPEAVAVASIIFNRSEAIRNNQVPENTNWGSSPNLIDVVGGRRQFAGYSDGWDQYESGYQFAEGQRNCNRLKAAGSAIAWLAADPSARQPFLFMCAYSHLNRDHELTSGEVVIGGNVFSANPIGPNHSDCERKQQRFE